jgi:tRNA threonylcarbamoyladenosine biosynthesis protein TsaB
VLPDAGRPSAELVPALDRLLKRHRLAAADIGGIAVGTGPGSFTGIRLGIATARGLSLARGIPIRGIGGFDNLLAGFKGAAACVCPIVDAHSYGIYTAVYEREGGSYRCRRAPFVCRPEELPGLVEGEVVIVGPHLGRFREKLAGLFGSRASFDAADRFPSASAAALLFDGPAAVCDDPPGAVTPLYLLPGVRMRPVMRIP